MVISGAITPGTAVGTGTLTFCGWYADTGYNARVDLGNGGTMSFKVLGDGTSVTASDLVKAGTMNFGGNNTINVALPSTPTGITNLALLQADQYNGAASNRILDWAGVTGINFSNTAGYASYGLSLSGDGNTILLNATTAVPEPASLCLLSLSSILLLRRRRRA
jgi:hypothetical protein